MRTTPASSSLSKVRFHAPLASALALAGWLASPAGSAAGEAAEAVPRAASRAAPARPAVTFEQVRTAMRDAERRRVEAARPDPAVPPSVADRWGVQVLHVSSTADGFWLDFRFRVIDAQKALPLFDSRVQPYLESERSGARFAVPAAAKVGALRTTNRGHNIKPDKIYAIMFANPGFHVQPGHKVSVVAGDFKVEHLTVN